MLESEEQIPVTGQNLKFGESYLITGRSFDDACELFYKESDENRKGLIIWRNHPKKYNGKSKNITPIWITNISTEAEHLQPHEIEQLSYNIEQFMTANEHSVVMLSCIEYLVSFNTFREILHLIQTAKDLAAEHDVLFLAYVGKDTLDKQEENLLRQELTMVGEHNE